MRWLFIVIALLFLTVPVYAAQYVEGKITAIDTQLKQDGTVTETYKINIGNKTVMVSNPVGPGTGGMYKVGSRVVLEEIRAANNRTAYVIQTAVRRHTLFLLVGIFLLLIILVARLRGVLSLLSLALSFAVIFAFILPRIIAGAPPVLIAWIGAVFFVPVSYVLSHGLGKKTYVSIVATLIALAITGLLAAYFVPLASLTGFTSDEASFVKLMVNESINIQALLIAGIIIGAAGILDDTTIAQAGVIFSLKKHSPTLSFRELFSQGMRLGKDHIASLVNTLILVYTGAALPLLLLFSVSNVPYAQVINFEIIAEEIVRTMVSSIGLVLAVPITTLLATFVAARFGGE